MVLLLGWVAAGRGQQPPAPVVEPFTPAPAPPGPVVTHTVDGPDVWEGDGRLGDGLFFWGEYLYLQPRRDALDFAVAGTPAGLPAGSVQAVGWSPASGLRAGLGWRTPQDGWALGFGYTYLHSAGVSALAAGPDGMLFATTAHAGGIDDVSTASATASLNYNVLDVELSRVVPLGEATDLRLFGGGRFAWIDQGFDAVYDGGSTGARAARVSSPTSFNGAGLSAGGEGTWRLYRGLGLYARARAALLSGEVRNDLVQTDNFGRLTLVNLTEKRQRVVPELELGLGLALEWECVSLRVGYELSNWFGLIDSPDLPDGTGVGRVGRRGGDLSLEGLAVRLGVQF
jgi:hypothetical protein